MTSEDVSPGDRPRAGAVAMRPATPADAGAMMATMAEAFLEYRAWAPPDWSPPRPGEPEREHLAGVLEDGSAWALLGIEGSEVAGHVTLSRVSREDPGPLPADTILVSQMFVRPPWRGQGVAAALMGAAIGEARRRGYRRLRLWTPRGAAQARRFYEREGWVLTGRTHPGSPFGMTTVEYTRSAEAAP